MIKAHISLLQYAARSRKPGYLDACLKRGHRDGEWMWFEESDHAAIREEFALGARVVRGVGFNSPPGLGDRVHAIAGPIGQAIHWPCMERAADGSVTQNLRPGSPCAKARALLNKI